jgi:hypothetical protein
MCSLALQRFEDQIRQTSGGQQQTPTEVRQRIFAGVDKTLNITNTTPELTTFPLSGLDRNQLTQILRFHLLNGVWYSAAFHGAAQVPQIQSIDGQQIFISPAQPQQQMSSKLKFQQQQSAGAAGQQTVMPMQPAQPLNQTQQPAMGTTTGTFSKGLSALSVVEDVLASNGVVHIIDGIFKNI